MVRAKPPHDLTTMRRLFRDIQNPIVEAPTPKPRRPKTPPVSASGRRRFSDIKPRAYVYGGRFVIPGRVPKFVPSDFMGSPYHRWAAKYFNDELWRALPHQEVDDLLQNAAIKYMRCVAMYVYGKCTCRGPKHLMNIFKRACDNLLTDESRKKMRCPEKYRTMSLDTSTGTTQLTDTVDLDCPALLDNSFVTALESATLRLEINYQE